MRLGLPDAFPHKYGVQDDLFEIYGLMPQQIAATRRKRVKQRKGRVARRHRRPCALLG